MTSRLFIYLFICLSVCRALLIEQSSCLQQRFSVFWDIEP